MSSRPLERAAAFCERYGLKVPILLAPMAGACPASLSIAVGKAGGMGAMGALISPPDAIRQWAADVRAGGVDAFQLNTWVADPEPARNPASEELVRKFVAAWGPPVPEGAGDVVLQNFELQCEAFLELEPTAVSSIMVCFRRST